MSVDPDNLLMAQPMKTPLPTLGHTVHYVSFGTPNGEYKSVCRASIVTEVGAWVDKDYEVLSVPTVRRVVQEWEPGYVRLCVLNPTGQHFTPPVKYDGGKGPVQTEFCSGLIFEGGSWHIPHKKRICDYCEDVPEWYDMEKCPRCQAKAPE